MSDAPRLYPITDPAMIAKLTEEHDSAIAAALLRGKCAAGSIAIGHACILDAGHEGPHQSDVWEWGGR